MPDVSAITRRPGIQIPVPMKKFRRDFSRCPRCGAPTQQSRAINGGPSEFFRECTECNVYINTYIPQKHQFAVHKDPHRLIGNFGAYGTGKTTTTREEIFKHLFITPNANILVGANVLSQYEQTLKREIEADFPGALVQAYSVQKQYFDAVNGARIMYRPFDDADKLRSYNLTLFAIVEASEVSSSVFHQLKTRLRNTSACVFEKDAQGETILDYDDKGIGVPRITYDWRRGIVESNPDSGWIRLNMLLVAGAITQHGNVKEKYDQITEEIDRNISVHVASTDVNRFLPPNFIEENSKGKPAWWVGRFLYGSFSYAEGLVYPGAAEHIVPTFPIPKEWPRIIAFDYGLHDLAVYLFGAIDQKNGILYIYREAVTNNANLDELAKLYFDNTKDIPSGGLLCAPIIDPKSGSKRDYNKDSLSNLFLERGIAFQPGYVNIEARIMRLNDYFESGRVKIMDCCTVLRQELREYKFEIRTLEKDKGSDKPVDKGNHAINPLEWIVMELPADPKKIIQGVYNKNGYNPDDIPAKNKWLPHALSDPEETSDNPDSMFGISQYSGNF